MDVTKVITIYDIAKKAGVSASTVSRVINNKPNIKPETREKIQKLLKEYDYVPDQNARGLINKATKLIGILVADIRNDHHAALAYTVERRLRADGYLSFILNTGYDKESILASLKVLDQRKVEGIVVVGSVFQNDLVENELKTKMKDTPVVIANGYLPLPNVYGILVDERKGIKDLVTLLHKSGKRKMAFMASIGTPSSYEKLYGYQDGLEEYKLGEEIICEIDGIGQDDGYLGAVKLLEMYPEIDAIICTEDLIAVGVIHYLNEKKIKIPKEVAVVGVNNSNYGKICYPKITTMNNKMAETANITGNTLIGILKGEKMPHKTLLDPDIVEREST